MAKIHNRVDELHPKFRLSIYKLLNALGPKWDLFEGYRTPDRQNDLFTRGKTKARAWQSAHQYGLGADIVPLNDDNEPFWPPIGDPLWLELQEQCDYLGLYNDIKWDAAHVYCKEYIDLQSVL